MYKYLIVLMGFMLSLTITVFAQEIDADTLVLEEIEIVAIENSFFQVGAESIKISDSIGSRSLSELIEGNISVYFIQYGGKGQLSTINLRGLGGSRTNLIWNGLEINSFTLGLSDFSLLNGAVGDVSIQKGSSSALFGNGAIGGAVSINPKVNFKKGNTVNLSQGFGSFGEFNTSIGYQVSTNKFQFASRFYQLSIENDFLYNYRGEIQRQSNAKYLNRGYTQHIGYWVNPTNQVSLDFWYNYNHRELQPNKGDFTNEDSLEDKNARLVISWNSSKRNFVTETKIGFTNDHQRFNNNNAVQVRRTFLSHQSGGKISKMITYKAGFSANYLNAITENYDGAINELRTDVFASLKWQPIDKFTLGINLREPLLNEELQPFTPSVALEYLAINHQKNCLKLDLQISRSYRIPTLNDRYWDPGGNQNLLSELSRNLETGFSFNYQKNSRLILKVSTRYFYHDVDNWIIWRPGGSGVNNLGERITFWFPDNIRKVIAQGVENEVDLTYQLPSKKASFSLNYSGSFTDARNKNSLNSFDRSINKQLPYTPRWINLFRTSATAKGWIFALINRVVSKRFTETNNELPPLKAYHLADLSLSKQWKKNRFIYLLNISVNNIGNTEYENFSNRAMPFRNYGMNFKINYNF